MSHPRMSGNNRTLCLHAPDCTHRHASPRHPTMPYHVMSPVSTSMDHDQQSPQAAHRCRRQHRGGSPIVRWQHSMRTVGCRQGPPTEALPRSRSPRPQCQSSPENTEGISQDWVNCGGLSTTSNGPPSGMRYPIFTRNDLYSDALNGWPRRALWYSSSCVWMS